MKRILKSMRIFKNIIFIFISFNTITYSAYKSNISGIVLDRETSLPVPGAVIEVLNHNLFYTTDKNGKFRIENLRQGFYKLKITHIAYNENVIELEISENSEKALRIFLVPKSIEINPVVVTDKLHHSKFEEISNESSTLKGKELERELGFNLAATLKNETGLAIRSMGPAPARPIIRGLGGNRVLISEDGNPTTDLSSTSPDHAVTVEPFNVNQVEVIRGPKVLLYAPTTTGGIVNAVKEEIPVQLQHKIHGTAGIFGESANKGYLGSLTAEIPIAPFSTRIEISSRKSDDLKTSKEVLKNSDAENINGSIGASFFTDYGFAGASWRRYELKYGVPGGFVGAHPNGVRIEMFRDQYNVKSVVKFNNEILEDMEINYSRVLYRHKEFEHGGRIGSEFRIINHLGRINFNHSKLFIFNHGTFGASFEYRDFTAGGFVFTPPSKSLNISAFFLENVNYKDFNFEFSARYNDDFINPAREKKSNIGYIRDRIFYTYSLAFSALYSLTDAVYIGGVISKSSRVPTIEELFSEGPHLAAYSYETGNPDLKSETGIGTEIFLYHKFDNLYFNITLFRNHINYYIIPRNTGRINYATFLPVYATTGVNALLYGIESQFDFKINNNISLNGNVSYTKGEIIETNDNLPQIPPLKSIIGIKYSFEKLLIGVNSEITASQKETDEFEEPTAGYTLLNMFIQFSIVTGDIIHNLSLSVDNIFNTEYRNHLSRIKSVLPEAGRNFRITYKLYF